MDGERARRLVMDPLSLDTRLTLLQEGLQAKWAEANGLIEHLDLLLTRQAKFERNLEDLSDVNLLRMEAARLAERATALEKQKRHLKGMVSRNKLLLDHAKDVPDLTDIINFKTDVFDSVMGHLGGDQMIIDQIIAVRETKGMMKEEILSIQAENRPEHNRMALQLTQDRRELTRKKREHARLRFELSEKRRTLAFMTPKKGAARDNK